MVIYSGMNSPSSKFEFLILVCRVLTIEWSRSWLNMTNAMRGLSFDCSSLFLLHWLGFDYTARSISALLQLMAKTVSNFHRIVSIFHCLRRCLLAMTACCPSLQWLVAGQRTRGFVVEQSWREWGSQRFESAQQISSQLVTWMLSLIVWIDWYSDFWSAKNCVEPVQCNWLPPRRWSDGRWRRTCHEVGSDRLDFKSSRFSFRLVMWRYHDRRGWCNIDHGGSLARQIEVTTDDKISSRLWGNILKQIWKFWKKCRYYDPGGRYEFTTQTDLFRCFIESNWSVSKDDVGMNFMFDDRARN